MIYQALVPFCDGGDIFDVLMEFPKVKLTGRKGKKGKLKFLEVEFHDYEPTLFKCKPRIRKVFIPEDDITYITE